jgi:histone H1/5
MPPKAQPEHPTYKEMIVKAIADLKDRKGSSRIAIKKYILANYTVIDNGGHRARLNKALT